MNEIRLLIVDKDTNTRIAIKTAISPQGFAADEAADGIAALKLFRRNDYSLVILETDLPMLDGGNVCRQIRKISDVPVIVVSTRCAEADKLYMFTLGADDYLCKPFWPNELMARVRVFLHRTNRIVRVPAKIDFNGLFIDTVSRAVTIDNKTVPLTPKEYELLFYLSQNPNKALSREMLLNELWGYEFMGSDRTVDTHIKTLRENLKPYDHYIVTVWGFGYKFCPPE
jgi:two-component system, OmpR family, response regulator ResD